MNIPRQHKGGMHIFSLLSMTSTTFSFSLLLFHWLLSAILMNTPAPLLSTSADSPVGVLCFLFQNVLVL